MDNYYFVKTVLGSMIQVSKDVFEQFIDQLSILDPEYFCKEFEVKGSNICNRQFISFGDMVCQIIYEVAADDKNSV